MKIITLSDAEFSLLSLLLNCPTVSDVVDISMVIPDQEQRREFTKAYLHRYFPKPTVPIHRDYDYPHFRVGSIAYYLNDRIKESTKDVH